MSLKLKLKVKPSKSPSVKTEPDVEAVEKPLPRIKIKHSASSKDNLGGISKPKSTKEKLKKLKLSLGKSSHVQPAAASTSEASAPVQPILKKVPKVRVKPCPSAVYHSLVKSGPSLVDANICRSGQSAAKA